MKKFSSILLLGVLFFNFYGYQLLHVYLEGRAANQLQRRLDSHRYDEADLISLKVPAKHLTYYNHSIRFENFNGQIEISGVPYCYVKRRLFNDSIEVLCIPNQGMMELQKSKNEFFTLLNDLKHLGRDKKSSSQSKNNFSTGYFTIQGSIHIWNPIHRNGKNILYDITILPDQPGFVDDHPPEKTT